MSWMRVLNHIQDNYSYQDEIVRKYLYNFSYQDEIIIF